MSNKDKDFIIKLNCNEAVYRALVLMLRHAQYLGNIGSSRDVGIYFDGDGHDSMKILELSETVKESKKGIQPSGDFHIDTDEVYDDVL